MKRMLLIPALIAAMPLGVMLAQSTPPASSAGTSQAQTAGAPRLAPGSVIPVQLTKTVDAKKAKTGDEVVAKVTQDMKTQTGEVLLPKDTKIIGHVTEAEPRSKEDKRSELAIAFDRAVMNGQEVPLPMSIQAVIAPQNSPGSAPGGEDIGAGATSGAGVPSSAGGGGPQRAGMGGSQPPAASNAGSMPSDHGNTQSARSGYPPINAQTQGVIGLANVSLSAQNGSQKPIMTSEKNNVKLETGTMLLLRVNG